MNKLIKGSLAGATGIALLMGGFGTYALWSDSEDLAGNSVTSGELDVTAGTVAWKDQNNATWNTATDLLVPGDTVKRTQSFTFKATGKNMKGAIRFTVGDVTEHSGVDDSFSVDVDVAGVSGIDGSGGCWEFTAATMPKTLDTTVTYTLNANDTDLQGVTAAIQASTFTVQQDLTCP